MPRLSLKSGIAAPTAPKSKPTTASEMEATVTGLSAWIPMMGSGGESPQLSANSACDTLLPNVVYTYFVGGGSRTQH